MTGSGVEVTAARDQAQLRVKINRYQVARFGINVSDVQDVIDLALGGSPITGVFEGDRRFVLPKPIQEDELERILSLIEPRVAPVIPFKTGTA